jgi:hypothetical protein
MDSLSADLSSRIGALELGDTLENYRDGALEASASGLGMTVSPAACPITQVCRIDDAALEAFSANLGPVPTMVAYGCRPTNFRCVSDGSLEAAGANTALGPTLGDYGCGAVPRTNYCVQ